MEKVPDARRKVWEKVGMEKSVDDNGRDTNKYFLHIFIVYASRLSER